MAIQKRKAVARNAQEALAGTTRVKGTKRAAEEAASAAAEEVEEPEEQDEQMEEEAPEEISEEDRVAREEEEVAAARAKELKGMPAADLKEMVIGKGLDAGKKEDNVAAILDLEAKARANKRAQEARQRSVVVKKKEELEALPFPELSERCRLAGILGKLTKQERIQQLMTKWQQDDGISKGLAAMATEERQAELSAMDSTGLAALCASAGVDPLLKEVMVDRLIKHEGAYGRFARPVIPEEDDREETTSKEPKADLVDAVLANESNRKKQKELQKKQEEAESSKRKELQAKSVEELKKMVIAKGREGAGKKGELVEVLMAISAEEEATAARRAKLRALGPDELRKMLASRKVEFAKNDKKEAMIEALFAHEAKTRRELELHEARAQEVESKKREELKALSASELKDMCSAKGLKMGTAKDDRIATLLEAARADGEVDRLVAAAAREARQEALMAMDKVALKALCDSAGLDVIVKDVVVERLLSHEAEHGRTTPAEDSKDGKPPAKKARTGKK
jgi:hypothetical protein